MCFLRHRWKLWKVPKWAHPESNPCKGGCPQLSLETIVEGRLFLIFGYGSSSFQGQEESIQNNNSWQATALKIKQLPELMIEASQHFSHKCYLWGRQWHPWASLRTHVWASCYQTRDSLEGPDSLKVPVSTVLEKEWKYVTCRPKDYNVKKAPPHMKEVNRR